ncbi:MAG: DinB family protein [Clostridia bacterium]|nr:DinB family protein [Clostridia bacterium]
MRADDLRRLGRYTEWADRRAFEAARRLPAEAYGRDLRTGLGSVGATLAHICAVEWLWGERLRGRSPAAYDHLARLATPAELEPAWEEVWAGLRAAFDALDDARLEEALTYRTTEGELFTQPAWQLALHITHHSAYHRGQVAAALRQLGAEPLPTDLVLYFRSKEGAGTAGGA